MTKAKIFDEDVEKYLLETGVSKKEINKIKFLELEKSAIEILQDIITAIKNKEYYKVESFLFRSPAGDCMGCDNSCINFGCVMGEDSMDISELCDNLQRFL